MLPAMAHVLDGDLKHADDITPNKHGHVRPTKISDTESSGSISSLSHQGAHENEEDESNAEIADEVDSEYLWKVLTTPSPVAEGPIHGVGEKLPFSRRKKTVNVEESLPLSEGAQRNGGVRARKHESLEREFADTEAENARLRASLDTTTSSEENTKSLKRDLADARAENAKLWADLDLQTSFVPADGQKNRRSGHRRSERAEQRSASGIGKGSALSGQNDHFAPRESKTLVWTGVSMTLVRNVAMCAFSWFRLLRYLAHNASLIFFIR
jgi:hypothetical protein